MTLPPTVIARRALKARMAELGVTGDEYVTVFRPTIDANFSPQAPVETFLNVDGVTAIDDSPTRSADKYLVLGIGVLCSTALANDNVEIEDVVLTVLQDVENFLLSDLRQGCPGVVITTHIDDAELRDTIDRGYFGGTLTVRLRVRNHAPETF